MRTEGKHGWRQSHLKRRILEANGVSGETLSESRKEEPGGGAIWRSGGNLCFGPEETKPRERGTEEGKPGGWRGEEFEDE